MIIVISGPGGVGKGTVVRELVERDPRLVLSRSWTTRAPRPGEDPDAYRFVDEPTFLARVAAGGFLEHAEFLGARYGTPVPEELDDADLVLEIDVQGMEQVVARHPEALCILVDAPSREVQAERLRGRGDPEPRVAERLAVSDREASRARALGAVVVVNDDLDAAVEELAEVIRAARSS